MIGRRWERGRCRCGEAMRRRQGETERAGGLVMGRKRGVIAGRRGSRRAVQAGNGRIEGRVEQRLRRRHPDIRGDEEGQKHLHSQRQEAEPGAKPQIAFLAEARQIVAPKPLGEPPDFGGRDDDNLPSARRSSGAPTQAYSRTWNPCLMKAGRAAGDLRN